MVVLDLLIFEVFDDLVLATDEQLSHHVIAAEDEGGEGTVAHVFLAIIRLWRSYWIIRGGQRELGEGIFGVGVCDRMIMKVFWISLSDCYKLFFSSLIYLLNKIRTNK